ncbi:MAG: tetratricopeptide repeat protein [Treponema sp.]|uniref:tetratricopeptide repeat protein n=1 Tax=Treponema sp. TaxID=166 RepID=UPI003FA22443
MASSILEQAKKQFARGNYQQVIQLLQPHVTQYVTSGDSKDSLYNASFNKSFPFYLYLGLACLHAGDIGGAVDYLTCARRIKMTDPDLLCAQAVLFLRRGDTARAIDYYLEAVEYNPNHALARDGLEFIRTHNTPEAIGEAVEAGEIKNYYPRPGVQTYHKKQLTVLAAAGGIAFAAVIVIVLLIKFPINFDKVRGTRADLSSLVLLSEEKARPIDTSGTYRYSLSEKEVLKAYQNAQKYFQNSQDNLAQIEVNRILSSNAAQSIKYKARLLMGYFAVPGFDTVRDIPAYSDVRADIPLYLDCWTVWSGIATNIQTDGENTSFDLLVGYGDRVQLEGIVPIFCNFSVRIDSERPIEVLGKIQQRGGVLFLKAAGIHQSQVPANKK